MGNSNWEWHYSRWTGVMYGPIPVGVIVVGVAYLGYRVHAG
ncbi:MAG: hypothetical protein ACYTGH_17860 [Planctomycetota bacterium]|jgi:hypothetical protein